MEDKLRNIIASIGPLDADAVEKAARRQDSLAKPPGSLGKLESLSIQIAGITGRVCNKIEKRRVIVLAADNGVYEEGVSSSPQSVTLAQTINLTRGLTGCAVLARHFGSELQVVDVGVNAEVRCEAVLDRKIAFGTKNLYKESAMTREQALKAILTGVELARQAKADGVSIVGVGEMGICNTTTSSAVLASLLRLPALAVTGRGGGITDSMFEKKKTVIDGAIASLRPDPEDPVDVLSKVGGFDLCAMCGVFLGCAEQRIPAVVDGLISITAALCAVRLCGNVKGYLILSHESFEKGYAVAAGELGLSSLFLLDMRLGEGSGCPLAFEVAAAACTVMRDMATFAEAEINDDYLEEIRGKDCFTA
ncbi:MAG: nicotinate-nucleotide--dimethylbenzimidazole phosphoribosyltransferase [Clostridiales bacterium]|jgi:nicotinate-nucleotide--dimethylbenzimidazole phosphoribosyltransferase|nr:nicotinate-nucleotide--dimethylbenzimidazole phosphoribosyltransferase [Clostridiales bacterium]